jgi:dTMP kinase
MRWIVVDGIDGSGKTTMAQWIAAHYQDKGEKVLLRVHPSPRWTGRLSRRFLEGRGRIMRTAASLFFILDVLGSLRRLKRDRHRYDTIVFVRYLMGTAYLPEVLVRPGYALFSHLLPVPGRLLLADIDPEIAYGRIRERMEAKEMFEDLANLRKARRRMLMLARDGWSIIDNSENMDRVRSNLERQLQVWNQG